mgnify:CR=1 FL=1
MLFENDEWETDNATYEFEIVQPEDFNDKNDQGKIVGTCENDLNVPQERKYLKQNNERCDPNVEGEIWSLENTKKKCRAKCDKIAGCIAYQFFEDDTTRECTTYTQPFGFTVSDDNYLCSILKGIKPGFKKYNRYF